MNDVRLPWNKREGIIYGCTIALLSSFLIGGYNVYDNLGYDLDHLGDFFVDFIKMWPLVFIAAFLLAGTVVSKISGKVISRFMAPTDSANAFICFNIIVIVLLMSAIMTFLGGFIGQAAGSVFGGAAVDVTGLLETWPQIWPRNFCIAFWVEMLIAQPVARKLMTITHKRAAAAPGSIEAE